MRQLITVTKSQATCHLAKFCRQESHEARSRASQVSSPSNRDTSRARGLPATSDVPPRKPPLLSHHLCATDVHFPGQTELDPFAADLIKSFCSVVDLEVTLWIDLFTIIAGLQPATWSNSLVLSPIVIAAVTQGPRTWKCARGIHIQ